MKHLWKKKYNLKIAIVTDTHFGARNDNLNFNEYFFKFYENIFFPTLKERGITTCVHMGDVVDRRKYISYRIANDFRSRFIEKFKELNIDDNSIVIYKIERQNEALQLVQQLQEMAAQKKK